MDSSDALRGVVVVTQFLYLGYWVLGWLVWKGILRIDNEGWFGRLAINAGRQFAQFWQDARWGMLAMLIIVGCFVVGFTAYCVALGLRAVMSGLGML